MINHVDHIYNLYLHEAHELLHEQIAQSNKQAYKRMRQKKNHIMAYRQTHADTHMLK